MSNVSISRVFEIAVPTIAVILLDLFFVFYIVSAGFEVKTYELMLGGLSMALELQWLPVVGIALVAFVSWLELSYRIFPRRRGLELDPLARLRLMRAIAFSVMVFVCALYIPYLLGSNWFWARLGELSKSVSQIHDFSLALLGFEEPFMGLKSLWQYSTSQVVAVFLMVLSIWTLGRPPRRPKKVR